MKFTCPQKEHQIKFSSVCDYLNHLQKCHIINERIKTHGETRNEYYFCAFCLQVFELSTERDYHIQNCKKENLTQIFKDSNSSIPLGRTGQDKIQELIKNYKSHFINNKTSKKMIMMKEDDENIFHQDVVITADPRLGIPKIEFNQIKAKNIPIVDKITFNLLGGHTKMEAAYFKLHNNYKLEQVNRDFSFKIKQDKLKQISITHNFQLTKKVFEETKVLEFCESKLDKNPEIYLQIIQNNGEKQFWLLIPESQNLVKDFYFDEPWCIFNINVLQTTNEDVINTAQIVTKKQDPIIQQLQMQLQKQEDESQMLKDKLKNSFKQIELAKELNSNMIQSQDKKETSLVQLQIKLREMDLGFENIKEQYDVINEKKLKQAESNLTGFYNNQRQLESYKSSMRREELSIDYLQKIRKLSKTVELLQNKKDSLMNQCENLKYQISIKQTSMNEKLAKASVTKQKIQMIKQFLCIQCKQAERNVIQFPCQHFLFCETCFLTKISTNNFSCPLFEVQECQAEQLQSKYKTVNIISL
ncbi:unnamed protein product [Paramecium primaurelia]|uniref:RING-type domain-containing protein n=1 Tax=Paramecium primaurelia TaxID=5886 RepID=A0A8S1PJB8_PARPR|nr:unnamed protein product [Paramecium primaurelia]